MDSSARDSRLSDLAAAVASTAATRRLAAELAPLGIPLMVLKGSPLQQRLFGKDNVHRSVDVDLLVPRRHARAARRHLKNQGWQFVPDNGLLWRLQRATAFERGGVIIDLHWGLHAHMVSPRLLRHLECALWEDATLSSGGWLEPGIESLLVYLAVNAAGKAYEKPAALRSIAAGIQQVNDWEKVERIARRARVWGSVSYAVAMAAGQPPKQQPRLLDGRWNSARVAWASVFRKRVAPERLRKTARSIRQSLLSKLHF